MQIPDILTSELGETLEVVARGVVVRGRAEPGIDIDTLNRFPVQRDGDGVELHVRQEVGDGQRVDEVRLPGMADLAPVLECREHIGAAQQLDVGVRAVSPDLLQEILEANHEIRCLTQCRTVQ